MYVESFYFTGSLCTQFSYVASGTKQHYLFILTTELNSETWLSNGEKAQCTAQWPRSPLTKTKGYLSGCFLKKQPSKPPSFFQSNFLYLLLLDRNRDVPGRWTNNNLSTKQREEQNCIRGPKKVIFSTNSWVKGLYGDEYPINLLFHPLVPLYFRDEHQYREVHILSPPPDTLT